MNGNFEATQKLGADGKTVIVKGWLSWENAQDPDPCKFTAKITQTSGPGSASAKSQPVEVSKGVKKFGDRVEWQVTANRDSGTLKPGPSEAEGWVKTLAGKDHYDWKAKPNLT